MNYNLGIDIGSSSIKVALVETETGKSLAVATRAKRGNEHGCHAKWLGRAKPKRLVVAYL